MAEERKKGLDEPLTSESNEFTVKMLTETSITNIGNRLSKQIDAPAARLSTQVGLSNLSDDMGYRTTSIGHLKQPDAPKHMPLKDKLVMGPLDKYKYHSKNRVFHFE